MLKLEWRDVDLKGGSVLLRATKNGERGRVPLLSEVHLLLGARSKVRKPSDARVLTGDSPNAGPSVEYAWRRAKEIAQVENLRRRHSKQINLMDHHPEPTRPTASSSWAVTALDSRMTLKSRLFPRQKWPNGYRVPPYAG